jgi:hypothetical protein
VGGNQKETQRHKKGIKWVRSPGKRGRLPRRERLLADVGGWNYGTMEDALLEVRSARNKFGPERDGPFRASILQY